MGTIGGLPQQQLEKITKNPKGVTPTPPPVELPEGVGVDDKGIPEAVDTSTHPLTEKPKAKFDPSKLDFPEAAKELPKNVEKALNLRFPGAEIEVVGGDYQSGGCFGKASEAYHVEIDGQPYTVGQFGGTRLHEGHLSAQDIQKPELLEQELLVPKKAFPTFEIPTQISKPETNNRGQMRDDFVREKVKDLFNEHQIEPSPELMNAFLQLESYNGSPGLAQKILENYPDIQSFEIIESGSQANGLHASFRVNGEEASALKITGGAVGPVANPEWVLR